MGFFTEIQQQYGTSTVRLLKTLARTYIKLASMRNRRIFLLKCRQLNLTPPHITHGTSTINSMLHQTEGRTGRKIQTFNNRLRRNILNLEIKATFSDLTTLNKALTDITTKLSLMLPNHILSVFEQIQLNKYNKVFNNIKRKNRNKLEKLKIDQYNLINIKPNWFKNLTPIEIPQEIINLLSLGPKFSLCPPFKEIKITSMLGDLENMISSLETEQRDCFRSQYTNVITNFMHKNHNTNPYLNTIFKKSKLFLKDHPDLFITRSDKGNTTVAISKDMYIDKSQELLNDEHIYKRLQTNPTYTLQLKANKIIKALKDKGIIDEVQRIKMTTYDTVCPRFYTLPKIHKPNLSMRPIVSSINCPNGTLSQFLTNILTIAYDTDNNFYVKDSFSFSKFINNFQLPNNYVLVSLDVVSLFTNLPLESVLNSLRNRWEDISGSCGMDFHTLESILQFIFDSNILAFNDTYYKQCFGTPMGSTISPILVNYVLDDLISDCLEYVPFHIPFVKRYVDDLILAVPVGRVNDVLGIFNSYNIHIQFTAEEETNNTVPFLDMLVIRTEDNLLQTKWYRKPYCSNRFISYHSYHPLKTKINLILGMKRRAINLTHPTYKIPALNQLKGILIENSYPERLINKFLFSTQYDIPEIITERQSPLPLTLSSPLQSANTPISNINVQSINTNKFYFSFPYIEGLTEKITKIFQNTSITIARKQIKTVAYLYTPTKMPYSKGECKDLVYKIPCLNCNLSYIGQTSRSLKGRLTSHKSDCRLGKRFCSLSEHVIDESHEMDWDAAEILEKVNNYNKRTFLEMTHIFLEDNTMNKKSDIQGLSSIYSYILKNVKENYNNLIDYPAPDE